jgi:hypothetical protein
MFISREAAEVREIMMLWREAEEKGAALGKIQGMLDANGFLLFFKKDDNLYAAPEESRVTFARMKHPDPEDKAHQKEASFLAVDLNKALNGEKGERVFTYQDLKGIQVIEREEMEKLLEKRTKNPDKIKSDLLSADDQDTTNTEPGKQFGDDET